MNAVAKPDDTPARGIVTKLHIKTPLASMSGLWEVSGDTGHSVTFTSGRMLVAYLDTLYGDDG